MAAQLRTTRRGLLQTTGASLLGLALADWIMTDELIALAQSSTDGLQPLNRFPRMMQNYLVRRVREVEALANERRAALKTKADAEKYVQSVRERIRTCFGPEPKRTPLNPQITGVVERDAYNIEKVIFESRPGMLVTANLYVPKGREFPLPGVVGTCGHSTNGKAETAYQSFAQALARQGYVVLIYDPIGQGERLQYVTEELKSRIGVGVREHLYAGNQQMLVGEFLGSWRAWDGVRALDYLLTRPEVDKKHLGVTGNSGGGTMTTWLCGVEHRWTMAAPACFVTTFRRNAENELPADTEQCPPKALALGLDHSDFLAALAPAPVIILGKEKDYFDARGVEESYRRLKHLYTLLGAEDNIAHFIGPTYHGYTQENREAMYRWFNRVTQISDAQTEPALEIEKDETIQCTPKGQVSELGSRTVFSFTKEKAEQLRKQRKQPAGDAIAKAIVGVLKLPETVGVPEYRILRPIGGRKYPKKTAVAYAVETEPGIHALVTLLQDESRYSRPPREGKRAVLYVSHQSADAELREEPLVKELLEAESGVPFFACDVRGIGESQPDTCGVNQYLQPYGSDFFGAAHSLMLDDAMPAQRTRDVLGVLEWLADNGYEEVHLAAKGWGAIPATFAAVVSGRVAQVTLKNALISYSAVAESEDYTWPLSSFVWDILATVDLPDCYQWLKQKKQLRQVAPCGPADAPA
ncbi:MAG: prolyl oligopeptidase family serine peptidase [Planctomycetaceae bacterium]|nr:prolyl oligopeptidase family serine peptidase [Planctomycetaceae bacterium]